MNACWNSVHFRGRSMTAPTRWYDTERVRAKAIIDQVRHDLGPGPARRAVNDRPYKDGTIPSGSGKKRQHKSGARQACGAAADTERRRAKTTTQIWRTTCQRRLAAKFLFPALLHWSGRQYGRRKKQAFFVKNRFTVSRNSWYNRFRTGRPPPEAGQS